MKWVAPIASVIAAALAAFSPEIQAIVASHPALAGVFGALGLLAGSLAPQPQKPA